MFDIMLISGPASPFTVNTKEEKEEEEKEKKGSSCQSSCMGLVIRHIKRLYKQPIASYEAASKARATLR